MIIITLHLLSRMFFCDWLVYSSCDRCNSLLAVSVCCSLGGPLSYGSLVVVFLDRGHPCFWNFYSTIVWCHISQKWYEFTTGDREIDRYGWVYRLVIENVDRCDWDYRLVIENDDRYGWDYRLLIENNGCYGPKKRLLWWKKRLVSENDYTEVDDPEYLPLWSRMERPGNQRGIVHVF